LIDVDGCHFGFGVADGFEVSQGIAFPARRVMAGNNGRLGGFRGRICRKWLVWFSLHTTSHTPVGLFGASAFAAVAAAVVTLADFCFWYIDFGLIPCTDAPIVARLGVSTSRMCGL
jgi:hypothetical protein